MLSVPAGQRPVSFWSLDVGRTLHRVHRTVYDARHFVRRAAGKAGGRFDAPAGEYGALYLGSTIDVALAEALLREPQRMFIAAQEIEDRSRTEVSIVRPLTLVKLFDEGLKRLGLDSLVSATADYGMTRAIGLRLYQTYPDVDGLAWRSRINNGLKCIVLFEERASAAVTFGNPLELSVRTEFRRAVRVIERHNAMLAPPTGLPDAV